MKKTKTSSFYGFLNEYADEFWKWNDRSMREREFYDVWARRFINICELKSIITTEVVLL